jgi:transcriptional regulator with XRE-family HTH domain
MRTEELSSPIGIGSASTNTIREEMLRGFQTSKEYRHAFVEEAIRTRITAQVRTIREQREWDYKRFAEEIGKKVSWAYRLEDPNEAPPTIPTLLRVAETLDIGLDVRFRSFSELLDDVATLNPESFSVRSFEEELSAGSFSEGTRRTRKVRSSSRRRRARASFPSERPRHREPECRVLNIGASRQQSLAIAS